MRRKVYIIRNGLRYLQGLYGMDRLTETDPDKMEARYTVYKYDAARIPREADAARVCQFLRQRTNADLEIVRLDTLTGEVRNA